MNIRVQWVRRMMKRVELYLEINIKKKIIIYLIRITCIADLFQKIFKQINRIQFKKSI